ncbi:MAG: 5-dehydro-4-deoxy-D-glucuronate isomerase [Lachnospiraceae bacterium]|jgi:4-deoxy-L-threo-5-hexosulose-uronate ketol-isomerase|nr:5-dehydro-4-deoxy-D-glucuronate isomerase [Lachnospiraceae bacterium]
MDIRYSANQKDFKRYTTQETRDEFLIEGLYRADEVVAVYSHVDRMVTLGCMPVTGEVPIDKGIDVWANFGTGYFLERREIGIFNIGGPGSIRVSGSAGDAGDAAGDAGGGSGVAIPAGGAGGAAGDAAAAEGGYKTYRMGYKDCLYITKGTKEVVFASDDAGNPAKFYMVSAPAHKACKTTFIPIEKAAKRPLGTMETSNKRVINQFIHPDVLETCQLSMGMTVLEPGSVWNTMPCHTHERRMEVYMYFEVPEGQVVFHMMGEGNETRHIVMLNEQAVISPSWSIHAGAGTSNYTFIWAMGGENQAFDDMDTIPMGELR